jgi:hypothetical protein
MSHPGKLLVFFSVILFGFLVIVYSGIPETGYAAKEDCISCHKSNSPGIVGQWRFSKHGKNGIGCYDCHKAENSDVDAFEHYGESIATIVSPKDCGQCHEQQEQEFTASHHSKAAQFIGSLDNMLGVAVEGAPAAILGCQQCHGSVVKVLEGGKLDPATWPNTGVGRVNPDGSKGSCTACHPRHDFSRAQVRQPENCGRCHMGPDHPQIEIYKESKHGILYMANKPRMNMESDSWVVGEDYNAAPTCVTCHMGATPSNPSTHDVGARISWTLRPVISTKLPEWAKRRYAMKDVCFQCHTPAFVDNFYTQFDGAVELYNNKFAKPSKAVMDELYNDGLLTKTPFDEKIEWTFFELWHHEGRRARHGASMMGPDYTQWHGFYEVAKNFYTEFLPEAEELKPGIAETALTGEYHKWKKGLNEEEMRDLIEFYKDRYGQ